MDRALPGPMIDLIRDGVPASDLRRRGGRAVWSALVRTAASAKQRGWDCWEWIELIEQRQSKLGTQAMLERGKAINQRRFRTRLTGAWETAEKWVDERPAAWSPEDIRIEIAAVRTWLTVAAMPDDHTAVMIHAVDTADRLGTTRPALPWRQVAEATGLNPRRTRDTLAALIEDQALTLDQRGYAGRTKRRANLYRLPDAAARDAYLYRGTRSMDQPTRSMDQPADGAVDHGTDLWTTSDHITITGTPQALAQLLDLARMHGVAVNEGEAPAADNVIPIRRNA